MRQVVQRYGVAVALLLTVVATALFSPSPFAARTSAAANGYLGPNFPALVDSNGDGVPDAGDTPIVPTLSGTTITIPTQWQCVAGPQNQVSLSNPNGSGQWRTASRSNGSLADQITFTSPTTLSFSQTNIFTHVTASGTGTLVDTNGDGLVDTLVGSGTNAGGFPVNFSISLVGADTDGDGHPDYVSIPWSQAGSLGVNFSPLCGGSPPQIWIPLADTNGDGIPDSIVLDLNGDGIPDPQFLTSPRLGPTTVLPVPDLGTIGRLLVVALLGGIGLWSLTRRRPAQAA